MNKRETALLKVFRSLTREAQDNLSDYAEFLLQRYGVETELPVQPLDIPRPQSETVIAAIKRLSQTYPMLNKDNMLHETSGLMAQHLLQGRDAVEVIDELEAIFLRQYNSQLQNNKDAASDV
ncbi:hypothetical protein [Kaarinaea lacus]